MTGIVAVVGENRSHITSQSLLASITASADGRQAFVDAGPGSFGARCPPITPSSLPRLYESDQYIGLIYGDPVSGEPLAWPAILDALFGGEQQRSALADLNGAFALIGCEISTGQVRAVTDSFGFQSLYLASQSNQIIVSTSLAPFLRFLNPAPEVDLHWIEE